MNDRFIHPNYPDLPGVQAPILSSKTPISTPEPEGPAMDILLFGGFRVFVDGRQIEDPRLSKVKVRLLLVHLATRFGREVGRDTLLGSLWPDFDRRRALENFYVTWSLLRRSVGDTNPDYRYFLNNGHLYSINPRLVHSDIEEFDALSRAVIFKRNDRESLLNAFMRMDELYSGDVLSGYKCDDYTLRIRDRYKGTYVDSLIATANTFIDLNDPTLALWFARKAISIDCTREDVYQTLMLAQGISGQRTAAIDTFFMCREYLDDELGLSLSRKTIEIYEKLLNDEF